MRAYYFYNVIGKYWGILNILKKKNDFLDKYLIQSEYFRRVLHKNTSNIKLLVIGNVSTLSTQ